MTEFYFTTIPHTASHFGVELLDVGLRWNHVHAEGTYKKVLAAPLVITTLRRPEACWSTWWKRGEVDKVHCPNCGPMVQPSADFWGCWMLLDKYDREGNVMFLPVDHPDRNDYLAEIGMAIGRELETDWEPKGETTEAQWRNSSPAPEIDLSEIYAYDFVRRIYGDFPQI